MADGNGGHKYWEGVIGRWRASGKSMRTFAREHELSYTQAVRWRRRIESAGSPKSSLTLLSVSVSEPAPAGMGAPVQQASDVLIRLRDGVEIVVSRGFDAEVLRAVVRTLSGTPAC
jgi:hypothetical protein